MYLPLYNNISEYAKALCGAASTLLLCLCCWLSMVNNLLGKSNAQDACSSMSAAHVMPYCFCCKKYGHGPLHGVYNSCLSKTQFSIALFEHISTALSVAKRNVPVRTAEAHKVQASYSKCNAAFCTTYCSTYESWNMVTVQ